MFLGARASDDQATAITDPTAAVRTRRAAATSGAPTAGVNAWDSSRSGENNSSAILRIQLFVSFDALSFNDFYRN